MIKNYDKENRKNKMTNHVKSRNYVALVKTINDSKYDMGYLRLYRANNYYQIPANRFLRNKQAVIIENDPELVKNAGFPRYSIGVVMHFMYTDKPQEYPNRIKLVLDSYFDDLYSKRNGYNKMMSITDYPRLKASYEYCHRVLMMLG